MNFINGKRDAKIHIFEVADSELKSLPIRLVSENIKGIIKIQSRFYSL